MAPTNRLEQVHRERVQRAARERRFKQLNTPYTVKVRCGRCQRVLGSLYGHTEEQPSMVAVGHREPGMLSFGSRCDWFRHHKGCSGGQLIRWDKLKAAWTRACEKPPRERTITLPFDV